MTKGKPEASDGFPGFPIHIKEQPGSTMPPGCFSVRSTGLEFAGRRIAVYCHVLNFPYLQGFSFLPVRLCVAVCCRIRGKFRGRIPLHIIHAFRLYNGSTSKENRHAGTGATALGDTNIIASVGQYGQAFSRISRISRFTHYTISVEVVQKRRQALDRLPPMLYNGVGNGKAPAIVTYGKAPLGSSSYPEAFLIPIVFRSRSSTRDLQ